MKVGKIKLTGQVDEKGQGIFEIEKVEDVKKDDSKKEEHKLEAFKAFLEQVTEVDASLLTRKFSI